MQTSSSQNLGGRQFDGPQTCLGRSTTNVTDKVTSLALTLSLRLPTEAVLARSKDKIKRCAVALLTRMLETPSLGLMAICDALTCERLKKPAELMVNVGVVPAWTFLGETLMGG